jgi:hypothetical protein
MKKLFGILLATIFLLLGSNAIAFERINSYWDLNTVDGAYFNVDDGVTETFKELTYYAETVSEISALGHIVDAGAGFITSLNTGTPLPHDDEGLNSRYGMTFLWDDLTGDVTSNDGHTIKANYTSGTIDFYIDFNPLNADISNLPTLTDGTLVATVEVTSGSYELDLDGLAGSSYLLNGEFTYLLDDFWYTEDGTDLADDFLGKGWVMAYTAGDNDANNTDITDNGDGSLTVFSPHDSSIEVGVVPEPATMALFGLGLLALAGVSRKK